MRPKDDLDRYYEHLLDILKEEEKADQFPTYFYNYSQAGNNRFYQKNIKETKFFDEEWIRTLESYFASIDKIIKNPKTTIRYEEEVVAIEKARKINSTSVRHLASHTHNIKEIRDGDVIPKKILTTFTEDELATYENRFIKTLIDRLYVFVINRHAIIKENVESFQKDHLHYNSDFDIKNTKVTLSVDLVIKKDLDNAQINKHNYELLDRVEKLVFLINGFKNSLFMQQLSKAKDVHAPIMKTNVILKNPDFRNAYTLWLFLDRYNSLAYDVNVQERPIRLSRAFGMDLHRIALMTYSMFYNNAQKRKEDFEDTENFVEIKKKSTKIAKKDPADFVSNPDAIILSDNLINEYYLEQYKKQFSKRMNAFIEEKTRSDQALRKALKETVEISNALYDSLFNLEEEEDYFRRLVTTSNPKEDYKEAKQKIKYAKVIREVKEADYKRAIKLEKSLMKEIVDANKKLLQEQYRKKKMATFAKIGDQIDKEIKKRVKIRAKAKADLAKNNEKVLDTQKLDAEVRDYAQALNQKVLDDTARIKQEEQAKLEQAIVALRAKNKARLDKLKADCDQELKLLQKKNAEKIAKQKAKNLALKEAQKQKMAQEKAKAQEKLAKARLAEKQKAEAQLQKEQAKHEKDTLAVKDSFTSKAQKLKNAGNPAPADNQGVENK